MLEEQTVNASKLADDTVTTVRVLYSDLHGVARGKDVPVGEFDRVAETGLAFCSSIMGTDLRHTPVVGGEEAYPDFVATLDLGTLVTLPWEPGVASCLADLQRAGHQGPEPTDPRGAVRRAVAELAKLDFAPVVGPELEFYLCKPDEMRKGAFVRHVDRLSMVYAVGPQADPGGIVRMITESLSRIGLETFAVNHEFSNSQYEINLREAPALLAADRAFRLKSSVKDIACQHGLVATFMGKPFNDQGGSGFHVHVSLNREDANAFADAADADGISAEMRRFLSGVLAHAPALMAFLNPTINAYRRIIPDSLAPTHANWGWDNRTTMVRVPPERGGATRLEVRVGDGSANPYLAIAALLFAGLHGLQEALPVPSPIVGDAYRADEAVRGVALPTSFEESIAALEADDLLRGAVGAELVDTFLAIKRFELERFRTWVSDWEIDEYLQHL